MITTVLRTLHRRRWQGLRLRVIGRWHRGIAIFIPTMIADCCCEWHWGTFYRTLPVSSVYTFVIELHLELNVEMFRENQVQVRESENQTDRLVSRETQRVSYIQFLPIVRLDVFLIVRVYVCSRLIDGGSGGKRWCYGYGR